MSNKDNSPYSLEIQAHQTRPGNFGWIIRKHGKMVERSDRPSTSLDAAHKKGEESIERLLGKVFTGR